MSAAERLLGDTRRVECDCEPQPVAPILLDPDRYDAAPWACLSCGAVSLTTCRGDDGRYTGEPSRAYFALPMADAVRAWIALWPRVQVTRHDARWPMASWLARTDLLYLPAGVADLRDACFPASPPPSALPPSLRDFAAVWKALHQGPDSPLDDLIPLAALGGAASPIAARTLAARPDADAVLWTALFHEDEIWQRAGYALAGVRGVDPQTLIALIESLPTGPLQDVPGRVESGSRLEALLVLIADLKLADPALPDCLRALRRTIAARDAFTARCIGIVLEELS